ncbi:biopolymer transport protein ExbD [Desulfacinum hydrothermale DSM 13146]|uniref:Biopolymer transport protein ExbD n=1 Tax=Desulfacinum hydrothermale DSM 13146 TaxID=1121390 RepID=A0A1W1XZ05_9BACT|nr:biopolymer transporter ExbD [Desulfacinum hydrothermale]SMC28738.1 biopolymer transport protein ExbD [Desulfacinum hydrothermale DSM 13146]
MLVHRKKRARYTPQAPLTALIDIVFLLLIYFLLTTNFMAEEGIQVNLPRATSAAPKEVKEMTVMVDADGAVYVGGTPAALADLFQTVQERLASDPETVVVVEADRSLVLDRVVQVMDVIKAAGASRLRLATERAERESP